LSSARRREKNRYKNNNAHKAWIVAAKKG